MICSCNNSEVNDILIDLPLSLKGLYLKLDFLKRIFPVPEINLTGISHLTNLEQLTLIGGSQETNNELYYSNNTFEHLTKVRELHIHVKSINPGLDTMVRWMKNLEILDFTNTVQTCMQYFQKALCSLTTLKLNKLVLRNFQISGLSCYSYYFNISEFFNSHQSWVIEHLDLSRNMFGVIYPSVITKLPYLKTLDISYNYLLAGTNDPLFIEMLFHPSLEILNMENQGSGTSVGNKFSPVVLNNLSLFSKELSSDKFSKKMVYKMIVSCINGESRGNLTKLFNDSMIFCMTIRCIGQLAPHLLVGIPCAAFGNLTDWFDSSCPYFMKFQIAKSLKQFIAGNLNWVNRGSPKISSNLCMRKSHLRNISFAKNANWIRGEFFYGLIENVSVPTALEELEELNLSQNDLDLFPNWTLTSLHTLYLTANHIKPAKTSICNIYPNLKYLVLSSNNISSLYGEWLGICSLLENLDLSHNSFNLTENQLNIENNTKLKNLNLNSNRIDILPIYFAEQLEAILKYQDKSHTQTNLVLTFTDNNLLCRCNSETIAFISWFQSTSVTIPDKKSYTCSGWQGKMALNDIDIGKFKSKCYPSLTNIIAESVGGTVSVICCVFILFAMYRYRWRVQYKFIQATKAAWCSAKATNKSSINNDDDSDENIKYDAFVSYCADDRFWVHDCLMKTLEGNQYGLRLCIHYRDFPLGEDISSVIVRSIQQSRNVIIVLSEQSIGRPWCQFEFQVALSEAVRRQTKLAVIKLGQFKVEEVNDSSVAWVLDNHTYLEWHENENAQKVFWFKLLRHLCNDADVSCCCFGSRPVGSEDVTAFAETDEEQLHLLEK